MLDFHHGESEAVDDTHYVSSTLNRWTFFTPSAAQSRSLGGGLRSRNLRRVVNGLGRPRTFVTWRESTASVERDQK